MIPNELVNRLQYIEIYTRKAARHQWVADYRSPLRGRGFEFDQHKPYQQGDDYRQIDWNATARMPQPYIKKAYEEKEMNAVLLADLSRSMEFATADQSKRQLLLEVSATLAFSAINDDMKVGLLGFTDEIEVDLPSKKGLAQVWKILETLWDVRPRSRGTNLLRPLDYLDARLQTASLLFCISDFIAQEEVLTSHSLQRLTRKHDFIPVILDDELEEALPRARGYLRLKDAERSGEMLFRLSDRNRGQYRKLASGKKNCTATIALPAEPGSPVSSHGQAFSRLHHRLLFYSEKIPMKCAALCALLLFVAVELEAATASQKGQVPFSVTTRLDRTAIWVGDSLEYTIQVIHPRSVQFVVDDLKKENLSLPPFVLRDVRAEERDWRDDKKLFEVVLLLTTYESGKSDLLVPPVALYYFRRDGTVSEKDARAQAIRVPPQKIALRSTLPGGQSKLREFKQIQPVDPTFAFGALALGLIGMGFVASRAAAGLWHTVHRDKVIKRPVSRRVRERWIQEELQRLRQMAKEPAKESQTFYAEIGQFMRQYLTKWLDVEAARTDSRRSRASAPGGRLQWSFRRNGYAPSSSNARKRNTASATVCGRAMASTRRH